MRFIMHWGSIWGSTTTKNPANATSKAGDIVALPFDTPEEEAAYIAETCKALRGLPVRTGEGERGISWSDIAVLLRSVRRDGGAITDALATAGVPYIITGMDNLFAKPEAEAARQLFYFLAGRIDGRALRAAWEVAALGIGKQTLAAAVANASKARDEMGKAGVGQFQVYNLQRQFMALGHLSGANRSGASAPPH
jgi:DNA helicase II / ATP-dependent DNA helicase PcrA